MVKKAEWKQANNLNLAVIANITCEDSVKGKSETKSNHLSTHQQEKMRHFPVMPMLLYF